MESQYILQLNNMSSRTNQTNTPQFKAIDFFCDGGGMTCGLRQAGINVIAGVDFDKNARFEQLKGFCKVIIIKMKKIYVNLSKINILMLWLNTIGYRNEHEGLLMN